MDFDGRLMDLHNAEPQCDEHLWNHEIMFETGAVRANEYLITAQRQVRRHNMDIFSIFFTMKVCCVFSLESPHRGDSHEHTQETIVNIKKENHPKYSQHDYFCSNGSFS